MKNNSFIFLIWLGLVAFSCTTKETMAPQNTQSVAPNEYFRLVDTLQYISMNASSWKDVDDFYRAHIAKVYSGELVNQGIFWISNPSLNFVEDAPLGVIEYYLEEAGRIDFNINLRLLIPMLDRVQKKWNQKKVETYAKNMYDKNVNYWNEHFPLQTIYLEKNKEALSELLRFQNIEQK